MSLDGVANEFAAKNERRREDFGINKFMKLESWYITNLTTYTTQLAHYVNLCKNDCKRVQHATCQRALKIQTSSKRTRCPPHSYQLLLLDAVR